MMDKDEPRRLVESWRMWRGMLAAGIEPQALYARLERDFAMVIRRRLGR